jgi:hypothetical protein
MKVLRSLHETPDNHTLIEEEYRIIEEQLTAEKEIFNATWIEIFKRPTWRRRLLIVAFIQVIGQLSGVNCINYYAGEFKTLLYSTVYTIDMS